MQVDLDLISIDDLIQQIYKRKPATIIAYMDVIDGQPVCVTQWRGELADRITLASVLNYEILKSAEGCKREKK